MLVQGRVAQTSRVEIYIDSSQLTPHDFNYACNALGIGSAARETLTFE